MSKTQTPTAPLIVAEVCAVGDDDAGSSSKVVFSAAQSLDGAGNDDEDPDLRATECYITLGGLQIRLSPLVFRRWAYACVSLLDNER